MASHGARCNSQMRRAVWIAVFSMAMLALGGLIVIACGSEQGPASAAQATSKKGKRYPVRGIYDRDLNRQAALGFNFMDTGPDRDTVRGIAARGLRPFIWLGGYSNDDCAFEESDDWVRSHVRALATKIRGRRHGRRRGRAKPLVGAYFIDDEPDSAECPTAPAQVKARSKLVKSIDPRPPTFIVTNKEDQLKGFAGTVDIIGLDHYPCSIPNGCVYSKIAAQARVADRLHIRYWGVIQAYGDDYYKVPTAGELHQEFVHWRRTHMEGYLVFAWQYPDDDPAHWLANNSSLQAQLAIENRR
jgi:hypothetical protein